MVTARRACLLLLILVTLALAGCGSASSNSAGRTTRVKPPRTLVAVLNAVAHTRACLRDYGYPPSGEPLFPTQTSNQNAAVGVLSVGHSGHGALIVFYANPGAAERLKTTLVKQKPYLRGQVRRVGSRTVATVHAPRKLRVAVRACVNA